MIAIMFAKFALVMIIGYFLGAIPFGVLITRRVAKVDVREYGSGKIGMTNVLRVAGRKAAALSVVLDMLKGTLAVTLAGLIVGRNYLVWGDFGFGPLAAQVLGALAAMVGHNWSIFLKFHGGRGVATFFGGLFALSPAVGLFGGEVLVLGAGLSRFASLGSIAGAVGAYGILVPLTIFYGFPIEFIVYTLAGTILIIVMHRDNIIRLIRGKERRLGVAAERIASPLPQESGK